MKLCKACGRKLKNQQSKFMGYGHVCYRRMFGTKRIRNRKSKSSIGLDDLPYYDIPGQMSIDEFIDEDRGKAF